MFYEESVLQEVRDRLLVSDVVRLYVPLKARGREFVGLSPFNKEKTPSFTVNDAKQFYHCFSSGKHGDIFSFFMEMDRISFAQAVQRAAKIAGVSLPSRGGEGVRDPYKDLLAIVDQARKFFCARLEDSQGASARELLQKRQISPQQVKDFSLGYAPQGNHALKKHLEGLGFSTARMVAAGLVVEKEGGGESYDRFRHRLMFPITDSQGRTVAFGGRSVGNHKVKYINSPDLPFFHKGKLLYNYNRARAEAHRRGSIIVVEGYTDVIALAHAGLPHAVAPLGTAMTSDQLRLLRSLGMPVLLCFDGDRAGQAAMWRVGERVLPLLTGDWSLKVACLSADMDPDSFIKKEGAAAFEKVLKDAISFDTFIWQWESGKEPLTTPESRVALRRRLRAHAAAIGDVELREAYKIHFDGKMNEIFADTSKRDFTASRQFFAKNGDRHTPTRELQNQSARARARGAGLLAKERLGKSLVFMALRYPALAQKDIEEFGALMVQSPFPEQLQGAIVSCIESLSTGSIPCSYESILSCLEKKGQLKEVERLQKDPFIKTFALSQGDGAGLSSHLNHETKAFEATKDTEQETPPHEEKAQALWSALLERYKNISLDGQIADVKKALATELAEQGTDKYVEKMKALKEQRH